MTTLKELSTIEKILAIAYRLGGWGILGLCLVFALKYVWDERTNSNAELIKELKEGKVQTLEIISQNADALEKSAESQSKVAEAVQQLTQEVRRNNSHN